MPKRMLIDAAHPEETRVVVTSGTRLEDFDFESSTKKQVKGNIYLAKITRVEPSLQAAFIDYAGNRHGFLAFSEIHPDYYRIPVSDRHAAEAEPYADDDFRDGLDDAGVPLAAALPEPAAVSQPANDDAAADLGSDQSERDAQPDREPERPERAAEAPAETDAAAPFPAAAAPPYVVPVEVPAEAATDRVTALERAQPEEIAFDTADDPTIAAEDSEAAGAGAADGEIGDGPVGSESVETFGGDEVEEVEEADAARRRHQPLRHYKIQEVIKRRQIMLVQVAKEERGNKGAALTTYLSLAGRYCVLMPNTNRGGGVSRKITSIPDRRRLKDILEDLDIPEGMGVIVRTAGAERSKAEIRRDYEYLLRLWNEIRDLTLKSTAPALIYEEGNLIKRSIRDLYARDIDEVLVEGEEAYKTAKAFMRTLMPSHAKRVQPYRDPQIGLFHRFQIETQIDAIFSPVAQLRSGGYLVINQTEALVSIDVNSGRATRERNIEETALRTNLEAADEIARQLRLRDLAGLIVIDFIDMEEHRNQVAIERRLKDALKNDRARIQVGRISPFGLLEMSRQRLRPSLAETSTQPCPHCGGTGFIRSVESAALHVLRSIEEEGIRRRTAEIGIYVPINIALYILNQKRESLNQIESRYGIKVLVQRDDSLVPPAFRLERLRPFVAGAPVAAVPPSLQPPLRTIRAPSVSDEEAEEETEEEDAVETVTAAAEAAATERTGEEDHGGRRRRPRRRRRTRETREAAAAQPTVAPRDSDIAPAAVAAREDDATRESEADRRRRRRGRRGGRARPPREEAATTALMANDAPPHTTMSVVKPAPAAESWIAAAGFEPPASEPGEPMPAHTEPERPEYLPEPTAEAEEGVPFVSETERVYEEAVAEAAQAAVPALQVLHGEAAAEAASAPPRPNDEVLTVTEKPTNPRRGWWQRLMQQ